MHHFGIVSLIPTGITILIAFLTYRISLALFAGIVIGSFILGTDGLSSGFLSLYKYLYITFTDKERLKIALFLFLVGGMLRIISNSGAYMEFARYMSRYLTSARKVRVIAFFLGILIFFDDYASVLIAGASVRTIAQVYSISPAVMAYIVDTVATVVSIMLISTWSAFEGSLMVSAGAKVGVEQSATHFVLSSVPYHLCTYGGMYLALLVAITGKWFGSKYENKDMKEKAENESCLKGAKFIHVFVPLITLVIFAVGGLFYFGYRSYINNGHKEINLISLLADAPTIVILIVSSLASLLSCIILIKKDGVMRSRFIGKSFFQGVKHMAPACLLIILSRGLSEVSGDLGTGQFITEVFSSTIGFATMPAIIAVIAALVTIATGISWSSMAILMPIAYQIALSQGGASLLPIVSGSVISGAILGGLLIPYSDTSVMASSAFKISPVYHVKTQTLQVITVFVVSIIGYLLLGFGINILLIYLLMIILLTSVHFILAK